MTEEISMRAAMLQVLVTYWKQLNIVDMTLGGLIVYFFPQAYDYIAALIPITA
jgi:hypothetical protein